MSFLNCCGLIKSFPSHSSTVNGTGDAYQMGGETAGGSSAATAPHTQNQFRPHSEQPIGHVTGRRMSAALQPNGPQSRSLRPIGNLPGELLGRIVADLSPQDLIALAQADPVGTYPCMRDEVRAAFIVTTHAPKVNTLEGFNSLVRMIQGIEATALQGEPWAALGAQIPRLPPEAQQAAIDVFLANAQTLPEQRPALLDELIRAAGRGPDFLAAREERALRLARVAVQDGESVLTTAQRYGITGEERMTLESLSLGGPAGAAVRNGASVTATAKRYGITDADRRNTLEVFSVNGPARQAVLDGNSVPATMERYGITDAALRERLEGVSAQGPAGKAVLAGTSSVAGAAQQYGITSARWNRQLQIYFNRVHSIGA